MMWGDSGSCRVVSAALTWAALLMVFGGSPATLAAQGTQTAMVDSVVFESTQMGEPMPVLISLPPGYGAVEATHPVLYVLDARFAFTRAVEIARTLAAEGVIPDLILVGITSSDRTRDMTPLPGDRERRRFPDAGGAPRFAEYIRTVVIPHIDEQYSTASPRILSGHSLAGLFSIYTVLSRPHVFDAAIASSPSLYWNDQSQLTAAERVLADPDAFAATIFFSMGNERAEMVGSARGLASLLTQAAAESRHHFEFMPDRGHSTTQFVTMENGLRFVFSEAANAG